jgi:hypothetical protein
MPRSRESRDRDNERKRRKRAEARQDREAERVRIEAQRFAKAEMERKPVYKITARRLQPKLPPNTSKQDLRDMIAEAFLNTARGK